MAHLLLIEDDANARELMLRVLAPSGHSISVAENGAVGLEKLAQGKVDLVLTDLLMPEVEGLETIREIRRLLPEMKIIAVSGTDSLYLEAARTLGANAILRKPFHLAELRATVDRLLSES